MRSAMAAAWASPSRTSSSAGEHDRARVGVEHLALRVHRERPRPVHVAAHGQRGAAAGEPRGDARVTRLIRVAARPLVQDEDVAAAAQHAIDPRQLVGLDATPALVWVTADQPDATDAEAAERDKLAVEGVCGRAGRAG